jgi:chemotaxis protein histidine kinase CheA
MKVRLDWVKRFRQEANQSLGEIREMMNALDWERPDTPEQPLLRRMFVKVHGLKGTAGMVGLVQIAEKAAELEALWGEALLEPQNLNTGLRKTSEIKTAELRALVEEISHEG